MKPKKMKQIFNFNNILLLFFTPLLFSTTITTENTNNDVYVMLSLKENLNPPKSLGWEDPDPCNWAHVNCSNEKRVTRIHIAYQNLEGTLPSELNQLSSLGYLEIQSNNLSGKFPNLAGLSSLRVVNASNNRFSAITGDLVVGLSTMMSFDVDNNPFEQWEIPESLMDAVYLVNFSANNANVVGNIPSFFGNAFINLENLHLAFNRLDGGLPGSLVGCLLKSLWVNEQKGKGNFGGEITFLQNFSGFKYLEVLSLRDNLFTGVIPLSLMNLKSLLVVNLTNNLFQGPIPVFLSSVAVDLENNTNSFCLSKPGRCSPQINVLLSIANSMHYPEKFAQNWKGNNPCASWVGIICSNGNITIVNFANMGLSGTISPDFSGLKALQRLVLSNNSLTGTIPPELTTIRPLALLDLSNNKLSGEVPAFRLTVDLNVSGNRDLGNGSVVARGFRGGPEFFYLVLHYILLTNM